jgi:hypothetical protein
LNIWTLTPTPRFTRQERGRGEQRFPFTKSEETKKIGPYKSDAYAPRPAHPTPALTTNGPFKPSWRGANRFARQNSIKKKKTQPTTTTTRRRRRPSAAAALPLLLLLALLLPARARARANKRRKTSSSCSALERRCGFGDSAWERNFASFVLTTPSGGGDPTCEVFYEGGPEPKCEFDAGTGALMMQVECYGGTGYAVVQQACGPIIEDDGGIPVLDPYYLPAPNQNAFLEAGYCGAEVDAPSAGESAEWYVQVFCAAFQEEVPEGAAAAKAASGGRPRPAVATLAQKMSSVRATAAAKAAAANSTSGGGK